MIEKDEVGWSESGDRGSCFDREVREGLSEEVTLDLSEIFTEKCESLWKVKGKHSRQREQ